MSPGMFSSSCPGTRCRVNPACQSATCEFGGREEKGCKGNIVLASGSACFDLKKEGEE